MLSICTELTEISNLTHSTIQEVHNNKQMDHYGNDPHDPAVLW